MLNNLHKRLRILFVSAEVFPFAKVGGLADVAGALPRTLRAEGHDVRVAMPCYRMIEENPANKVQQVIEPFPVKISDDRIEMARIKETTLPALAGSSGGDVPVYLIESPEAGTVKRVPGSVASGYFANAVDSTKVYIYAPEPYVFFCKTVLEMLSHLDPEWRPDIIHCNDWHTGLVPVFAKVFYANDPCVAKAATLFTIHNLAYQGDFATDKWGATGLPWDYFNVEGLEFYGRWSFMKGGLTYADRVNTVSETYSREIQTSEFGCGLEGLMRTLSEKGRLSGIINGIDFEEYNPAVDKRITANFSRTELAGKAECKAALQAECGFPKKGALIGLISRLADQKGFDLIAQILEQMLELPVQFALLGTGDPAYAAFFQEMGRKYPKQLRLFNVFDVELAQRIYSASDIFLMPSRFEPCGLGQMFAMRYGAVPVVRSTGGLADSVIDYDSERRPEGNGFSFHEYSGSALLATVRRAVETYGKKAVWNGIIDRAMHANFSWEQSAARYVRLYEEAEHSRAAQSGDGASNGVRAA